jgi:hypothetical protein
MKRMLLHLHRTRKRVSARIRVLQTYRRSGNKFRFTACGKILDGGVLKGHGFPEAAEKLSVA